MERRNQPIQLDFIVCYSLLLPGIDLCINTWCTIGGISYERDDPRSYRKGSSVAREGPCTGTQYFCPLGPFLVPLLLFLAANGMLGTGWQEQCGACEIKRKRRGGGDKVSTIEDDTIAMLIYYIYRHMACMIVKSM